MRVKFEDRWTREQLINSLCRLMDEMGDDGIEYLTGVNLYFHIEDSAFSAIELVGENELPITGFNIKNLSAPKKTRKRSKPKIAAPVVDIADFKRRKDGA